MLTRLIAVGQDHVLSIFDRSYSGREKELARISGVDGSVLFSVPVSIPNGVLANVSSEIDLSATSAGTIIAPAVAGKTFCPVRVQVFTTQAVGALSTAATIQVKQGASTIVAATNGFTNSTAFGFGPGGLIQSTPAQATQLANTATTVDVTIAATGTGGFIYKAKVIVTGFYM